MASYEESSSPAANKMTSDEYDVIVVGAGLAGLTTAYNILKKDPQLRIIVLEARDRVGGRTFTVPLKVRNGETYPFDLGAQWVGNTQHHILNFIKKFDLKVYPQYSSGTKVMQLASEEIKTFTTEMPTIGSWFALADYKNFMAKMERMVPMVPMSDPYSSPLAYELEGLTVAAMCDRILWTKAARKAVDQSVKANFGVDASRMGMLFFLAFANASGGIEPLYGVTNSAQEFKVKGGTQQISERLADLVGRDKIRLGCAVTAVDQQSEEGAVVLTYQSSTSASAILEGKPKKVRAKRVVVTAPPNLLTKISWSPPMHALKKNLCETLIMGHLYKFLVTYEKAHWRQNGYSGEIFSNGGRKVNIECSTGPLCECYDATTPEGQPAFVGFFAGRTAIEWCQKSKKEREQAVIKSLVEFLGPEMRSYIAYEDKMWVEDPWTGGCPVMYGTPGTLFALPHIRTPQGRVHFAGTETATVWYGYMSGAVQSGERAAWEVLMDLRPTLLTEEEKRIAKETKSVRGQTLAQPPPSREWGLPVLLGIVVAALVGFVINFVQRWSTIANQSD